MNLSLEQSALIHYVAQQLACFYPDGQNTMSGLTRIMPTVIQRLDHCFSHIHKKYYFENGKTRFHHLNSDHYAMFLYVVANEAWRQGFTPLAEKAFLLNKALHGIDAFYSITLPDVFLFVHPVGTVLGNATYADFLVVYQNVTVGSDVGGVYPVFGQACVLYSKCSVIGECNIGHNVSIAAHSFVRNMDVSSDAVVVGLYPGNAIKANRRDNRLDFFQHGDSEQKLKC